ncbi:hypothetical protein HYR54_00665 [Candidatus Acetothermia bacterium]|nr:hypothetical protein [Candidatus Acetothermia bacterium]
MSIPTQLSLSLGEPRPQENQDPELPIDRFFPEEAANELAKLESFNKHLYRPNTYLHKWWARRSGTTFRYILKQLVRDSTKRDFYVRGGLEEMIILDPMIGGGTTLHEAMRMGANVIGVDIDPIPVLQAEASLNLIPLEQKMKVFETFFKALRESLAPVYQTSCSICQEGAEIQFTLFGLRRRCGCHEALFVDSLILRENNGGPHVKLCSICGSIYHSPQSHCDNFPAKAMILTKEQSKCEVCRTPFQEIREEPYNQRYQPLTIVGVCSEHGQFFKPLDENDRKILQRAREAAKLLYFGNREECRIPNGPKSDDLHRRNIDNFQELFTPRQLLYLHKAIDLLADFSREDQLWLPLLISTSLEFNSLLCGYKGADRRRPGAIRHVFSHHAYSFPYTALENNPISTGKTSGTLQRLFSDRIVKGSRWALTPIERRVVGSKAQEVQISGEVDGGQVVYSIRELLEGNRRFYLLQGDARRLALPDKCVDYVVTDPPYYDSVQYSDLSNFFRAWLRLLLPQEANWIYDQQASAVFEGESTKVGRYAEMLAQIWGECDRVLKNEFGRLIFTFHHWKAEAWAELTISLKRAGFILVNRYVVFSENPISVHIRNLKALKHDSILVLKSNRVYGQAPPWAKPARINTEDSYAFCRDCGTTLGWLLNSDLGEEQIYNEWSHLIKKDKNGKASG